MGNATGFACMLVHLLLSVNKIMAASSLNFSIIGAISKPAIHVFYKIRKCRGLLCQIFIHTNNTNILSKTVAEGRPRLQIQDIFP